MATIRSVALRGDEAELYRVYHDRLVRRSIARSTHRGRVVEDACQQVSGAADSSVDAQVPWGEVLAGSSYVQVVTWDDGPCPDAATILTYSQCTNPRSPFFAGQTRLFNLDFRSFAGVVRGSPGWLGDYGPVNGLVT